MGECCTEGEIFLGPSGVHCKLITTVGGGGVGSGFIFFVVNVFFSFLRDSVNGYLTDVISVSVIMVYCIRVISVSVIIVYCIRVICVEPTYT